MMKKITTEELKTLDALTEKARIERIEYKLGLDNLLTLRQLENGAVIRVVV